MTMIDYGRFPNPCYIMEEDLLRKNLQLIKYVADEADVGRSTAPACRG